MARTAHKTNPTPSRAELRARRLADLKARAARGGITEQMFPTAEEFGPPAAPPNVYQYPLTTTAGPRAAAPDVEIPEGRLATLAHEINTRFTLADRHDAQANDHRLAAAIRLAEAKKVCEERKINFRRWAEESVPQSYETVRKLAGVGAAPDPQLALETWRARNAVSNAKLRERQKARIMGPPPSTEVMIEQVFRDEAEEQAAAPEISLSEGQQPDDGASGDRGAVVSADLEADVTAAEDGMEAVGLFHSLSFMDTAQRRAVADKAAKGLPAAAAREHVEAVAAVLGLHLTRDGSSNYHATADTVISDFSSLSRDAQREVVSILVASLGGALELPE